MPLICLNSANFQTPDVTTQGCENSFGFILHLVFRILLSPVLLSEAVAKTGMLGQYSQLAERCLISSAADAADFATQQILRTTKELHKIQDLNIHSSCYIGSTTAPDQLLCKKMKTYDPNNI